MEQELIYYMEKIDIHERADKASPALRVFCIYFREADESKGKKLSFILQEIGRRSTPRARLMMPIYRNVLLK